MGKLVHTLPPVAEGESPVTLDDIVTHGESQQGRVRVSVQKAQVRSVAIDEFWLEGAALEEVEQHVREAVNRALDDFNKQTLEMLQTATPELREINESITSIRGQLRRAFDAEMARVARGTQS